jgi:hypothetical protein
MYKLVRPNDRLKSDNDVVRFIGRIVGDTDGRRTCEIQIHRGFYIVVDASHVHKVEEYTDPLSGTPIANVYIRTDIEAPISFRMKVTAEATAEGANVPFGLRDLSALPNVSISEFRDTLTLENLLLSNTCCCNTIWGGDCTEKDPSQSFTASTLPE